MITPAPAALAKTRSLRETRLASEPLSPRNAMNLRPPSFRIVLALVGAFLVLWGSKGEVLNLPGLGIFSFFEMSQTNAWTLVASSVLVCLLSFLRPPWIAWIAWIAAIVTVALFARGLYLQVQEMRARGLAPIVDIALRTKEIKPGAVAILAGLVIQGVGLCLKRGPAVRDRQ
jgi:hypothetical protein